MTFGWNYVNYAPEGVLVKVPEKGDSTLCDNWRGIMLLCVTLKVLCSVILDKIKDKICIRHIGFSNQKSTRPYCYSPHYHRTSKRITGI